MKSHFHRSDGFDACSQCRAGTGRWKLSAVMASTSVPAYRAAIPARTFAALAPRLPVVIERVPHNRGAAAVRAELLHAAATIHMTRDDVRRELAALDLDPTAAGFAAVIYGHSHRPVAEIRHGVLFLNPGSAGPRRFTLPIAIAKLRVVGDQLSNETIELGV